MSLFDDVQAFVERAGRTGTLGELGGLMEAITRELGFDYYALVQHVDIRTGNTRDVVWLVSYPVVWAEHFEATGLVATDPIHVASQFTSTGFAWSEVSRLIRLSPHHKRVLAAASREGIGDGFTVPTHLPGEANASCSFAMRHGRALPTGNLMAAQLIGIHAMEAARKLVRQRRTLATRPSLTQRQRDCLVFVARGKTDWEIAQILGLKESTVRDYVDSACARYDVRRRTQLVVRALHDGQLTLRDAIG